MSLTLRHFLVPNDSEPLRLSQRLVEGLVHGNDAMPQYANSRQKVMAVLLSNLDGKPVGIDSTYGTIWTFDGGGEISAGLREVMADMVNSINDIATNSDKVVSITPQLNKKRIEEKYRWTPSPADIKRVSKDIWPESKSDRLKDAKGVSQRRPPLTYDAKHAISKATNGFWAILNEVQGLKEPSLKGFVYEARQQSKDDQEYRHMYDALARMGEDQLELLRRQKSGKGVWYALIEFFRTHEDGTIRTIHHVHESCEGRAAAIIATRRLLAEQAHLFGENITLEASVMTDLEWNLRGL
jgi:hypothetical protein